MISGLGTYRFFHSTLTPLLRVALVSAVLFHIVLVVFFQPTFTVKKGPSGREVAFSYPGWQRERQEQVSLSDSEPLYLPTSLNYGYSTGGGAAADVELGGAPLGGFSPELQVSPGAPLNLSGAVPLTVPSVDAVLPLSHWGAAATLGRRPQPGPAAPAAREAFLRVERMADGSVVFEEPVALGLSVAEAGEAWRPAAFSYWVDLQGAVGAPVPVPWTDGGIGPGNAAVKEAMERFLARAALAQRLRPGQYRIIIGP